MAEVVLNREIARQYTGGETRIQVAEDSVRGLIRALDAQFPGLGAVLRTDMAVAIDGQIYQDADLEPVGPDAEVCFLPAIEGG
ncbi:MAG: MoaD/ThiS family protein [Alphaproteobacteria bacterium]|nr:MoaD/ThiS family protein [Alphaproteobacteria bacterium]